MSDLKRSPSSTGGKALTVSQQTVRLLGVVDDLKANGTIRSDVDLCSLLNYKPQSFSKIRKGKRNATVELITDFCRIFSVNSNFIMLGQGPKITFDNTAKKQLILPDASKEMGSENITQEVLRLSESTKNLLNTKFWDERIKLLRQINDLEEENATLKFEYKTIKSIVAKDIRNLITSKVEVAQQKKLDRSKPLVVVLV